MPKSHTSRIIIYSYVYKKKSLKQNFKISKIFIINFNEGIKNID